MKKTENQEKIVKAAITGMHCWTNSEGVTVYELIVHCPTMKPHIYLVCVSESEYLAANKHDNIRVVLTDNRIELKENMSANKREELWILFGAYKAGEYKGRIKGKKIIDKRYCFFAQEEKHNKHFMLRDIPKGVYDASLRGDIVCFRLDENGQTTFLQSISLNEQKSSSLEPLYQNDGFGQYTCRVTGKPCDIKNNDMKAFKARIEELSRTGANQTFITAPENLCKQKGCPIYNNVASLIKEHTK